MAPRRNLDVAQARPFSRLSRKSADRQRESGSEMFTTVIQIFAQRVLPLALGVTVVCGLSGMALVAYFAPDLVEYFVSSSRSTAAAFDPTLPIVPWPAWP